MRVRAWTATRDPLPPVACLMHQSVGAPARARQHFTMISIESLRAHHPAPAARASADDSGALAGFEAAQERVTNRVMRRVVSTLLPRPSANFSLAQVIGA